MAASRAEFEPLAVDAAALALRVADVLDPPAPGYTPKIVPAVPAARLADAFAQEAKTRERAAPTTQASETAAILAALEGKGRGAP